MPVPIDHDRRSLDSIHHDREAESVSGEDPGERLLSVETAPDDPGIRCPVLGVRVPKYADLVAATGRIFPGVKVTNDRRPFPGRKGHALAILVGQGEVWNADAFDERRRSVLRFVLRDWAMIVRLSDPEPSKRGIEAGHDPLGG